MFFEGAEKKVEIVVSERLRPLTNTNKDFWIELVKACNATILSEIHNEKMSAYLLSESSLFVWDDRILMLTCGQTNLVESALLFMEQFGIQNIDSLIFQRKNEYRAQLQPSSFLDDVEKLKSKVSGKAYRFGTIHSHHTLLFHLDKVYECESNDTTTELLMYDICPDARKVLTKEGLKAEEIRSYFQLSEVFKDFKIDDYAFQPYGYSLNAIKGEEYFTIHVTPQEMSPYVSFETNVLMCKNSQKILSHFLNIFNPGSFDVVTFNCPTVFEFGDDYWMTTRNSEKLKCGYNVDFQYFYSENMKIQKAIEI